MIELIPALPDNVVGIVAKGHVTASDCHERVVPAVEQAFTDHDEPGEFDAAISRFGVIFDSSVWLVRATQGSAAP